MSETHPTFLVTGATGFLGRHVIEAIRAHQPRARIIALVRDASLGSRRKLDYLEDVTLIAGSPLDTGKWKNDPVLASLAGIYHLAAEVKHSRAGTEEMTRFNVEGTAGMVRLAHEKLCRIVLVSTSGTVGCSLDPRNSPDDDAPWCESVVRKWPYYLSKIDAEKKASAIADELGVDLVIIRPPVLLGPGDHRFRSTGNLMRVLNGHLPFIFNGWITFVDVRDAACAIVKAMHHRSPRRVYNLPGASSTVEQFFRQVARLAGMPARWRVLPTPLVLFFTKVNDFFRRPLHVLPDPVVIEMASHNWKVSSLFAESDLGFRSRHSDETVFDTIEWIRALDAKPAPTGRPKSAAAS